MTNINGSRPIDALLARTRADILGDGKVEVEEVRALARLGATADGDMGLAAPHLGALIDGHGSAFDPAAMAEAQALLGKTGSPMPRPANAVFRVEAPPGDNVVRNHQLFITKNGKIEGDTGIEPYSRGWLQFNKGVLGHEHGSRPPASIVLSTQERNALEARTPGQRLDRAAQLLTGGGVGMQSFDALARSKAFSDPEQPDFAGVCYAWSWAALDKRLSKLVDVEGPEGQRGLWIAGEWLSRADLGNWLMALLAGLSQGAGDVMWYSPEAPDLLKAALGYLMEGGTGFRADIGPALENPDEICFQPFVSAVVEVSDVAPAAAAAVLNVAAQPVKRPWGTTPGVEGVAVKAVKVVGRYADEVDDDHEGPASMSRMAWSTYAVLDGEGRMLDALLASDPRLANVTGLPTHESAPVPRELFAPEHTMVDGILAGEPPPEVEGSVFGPHLDFLVGTVLARGVPGATRAAFERERALRGGGVLSADAIEALVSQYPTIAAAYAPEQWAARFAPRGLEADRFGGVGA